MAYMEESFISSRNIKKAMMTIAEKNQVKL